MARFMEVARHDSNIIFLINIDHIYKVEPYLDNGEYMEKIDIYFVDGTFSSIDEQYPEFMKRLSGFASILEFPSI